jgi:hypothetical protein
LIVICAGWFLLELLFELGQLDAAAPQIVSLIPDWFSDWPILDHMASYFIAGQFDPLDVVSISLGSAAAGLILFIATRR